MQVNIFSLTLDKALHQVVIKGSQKILRTNSEYSTVFAASKADGAQYAELIIKNRSRKVQTILEGIYLCF